MHLKAAVISVLVMVGAVGACAAPRALDLAGAPIVVGPKADGLETLAARELQRYLRLISGRQSPISTKAPAAGPYIALGTPSTSPYAASALRAHRRAGRLGDEGSLLATDPRAAILAAETPRGVLWAVYGLLQRLGIGFYLGGDALAGAGPPRLPIGLREIAKPAFRVRGSLPWYNFLNSPTTWDRDDYRFFFDQMAKMRMNLVGFHTYDSEPFAAYEWKGKLVGGEPLVTASNYAWGAVKGLTTLEFGFGTGDFFSGKEFGSRSTTAPGSREQRIRRQQALLADGLRYARSRGLRVCVGFEVNGDPTVYDVQAHLEARLRALMRAYPMLDYVWIWQSEGLGAGSEPAAAGSQMELAADRYAAQFGYLKDPKRIHEAVRVMLHARLAHGILKRIAPQVRLAVSGWGGDRWMRFSDFYPGLDKTLPQDVIFAALDNIDPSIEPNVSAAYGKLSARRERWPIPWWESDGGYTRRDQWGPQCNARPFLPLCRDALRKGCQGMLAIHWRTRDVEEAAALQAQFAWEPSMTYERFFDRFARSCYGAQWASEMSSVHQALEALGPRYTGAYGQVECGTFSWFSDGVLPKPENLAKLAALRERIVAVRENMTHANRTAGLERIDWLLTTIDWLTRYDAAAMVLRDGGALQTALERGRLARRSGDEQAARIAAAEAAALFRTCGLADAVRTYPWKMSTCGEWGSLATINVKAYAMYRRIAERIREAGGDPRTDDGGASVPARNGILMRTPPSLVEIGRPVAVEAIVMGATRPRIRYRAPGGPWRTAAMKNGWRRSWTGMIPGTAVTAAGIEYRVEADGGLTAPFCSASAIVPVGVERPPARTARRAAKPGFRATVMPDYEVRLTWDAGSGATYRLTRSPGNMAIQSKLGEWSDVTVSAGSSYRYFLRSVGDGGGLRPTEAVEVAVPRRAVHPAPKGVAATPGPGKVRLTWEPSGARIRGYLAYRDGALLTPEPVADHWVLDIRPGDGPHRYEIAIVDRGGQVGPRSAAVVAEALPRPTGPAFVAALTSGSDPAPMVVAPAQVAESGLDTRLGGWATFPIREDFQLSGEFAVTFRYLADTTDVMPVLAACGEWQKNGWFVQFLSGRVRFSLGGDSVLDAGWPVVGRWQHLACTYDGLHMRVYLDGVEVGARRAPHVDMTPWTGPLVMAQYCRSEEPYQFRGLLSDLRVYGYAPSAEEIAEEASALLR